MFSKELLTGEDVPQMKKVAVIMGSDSDLSIVEKTILKLKEFGLNVQVRVISAHKSPNVAISFAKNAVSNGFGVLIAAAGMAAHLAGFLASQTILPVIGLPIGNSLNGMDALLSTVQMPSGVPVATVGINAAENAAILAVQILAINDEELTIKLNKMKKILENSITEKNEKVNKILN